MAEAHDISLVRVEAICELTNKIIYSLINIHGHFRQLHCFIDIKT